MFVRKSIIPSAITAAVMLSAVSASWGAITATLPTSGFYQTAGGVNIPAGTLLQIVNLGANGVFDPINIGDGSTDHLTTQWVSGDDSVINVPFEDASPDFTSLGAFDLTKGNDSAGIANRSFTFTVPGGTKFGIRWFPGLLATSYYLPGGITLAVNQPYGEFTRQNDPNVTGPLYDGPLNGLSNWVYTTDGDAFTLDPLLTQSTGAPNAHDANSLGLASKVVVQTPEPGTAILAAFGAMGLLSLRRRRS
jgi:hypothetical protein